MADAIQRVMKTTLPHIDLNDPQSVPEVPEVYVPPSDDEEDELPQVKTNSRQSFSETDAKSVVQLCHKIGKSNCSITESLIKHILNRSETGKKIVSSYSGKQLADRVRAARRKHQIKK